MRQRSSREIYRNRWMRLREDAVILNNGEEGIYSVVEKADFVVVIPYHEGYVWLVEQLRYPVSGRFWEFPQGGCEPGTTPAEAAHRELREETGLVAEKVHHLGSIYHGYGYANQRMHTFVASGITETGEQQLDPEEGDLIYRRFSLKEVEEMLGSCQVQDSSTMCAYAIWRLSNFYPT